MLNHFEQMNSYVPVDLLSIRGFALGFVVITSFILVRYFLMVAPVYFYFQNRPSTLAHFDKARISKKQITYEIKYSVLSSFIFAVAGLLIGVIWQKGYSSIYLKFNTYGYWYLLWSFVLLLVLHEIYFYFSHRLMHSNKFLLAFHKVHHLSVDVSPWASFSFHPVEAVIQAAYLPVVCLFVPVHPVILISYLAFMTVTAISNHLGHEIINNRFLRSHLISGTHHSLHHRFSRMNFGLYFCFMDRFFKTEYAKERP